MKQPGTANNHLESLVDIIQKGRMRGSLEHL